MANRKFAISIYDIEWDIMLEPPYDYGENIKTLGIPVPLNRLNDRGEIVQLFDICLDDEKIEEYRKYKILSEEICDFISEIEGDEGREFSGTFMDAIEYINKTLKKRKRHLEKGLASTTELKKNNQKQNGI